MDGFFTSKVKLQKCTKIYIYKYPYTHHSQRVTYILTYLEEGFFFLVTK